MQLTYWTLRTLFLKKKQMVRCLSLFVFFVISPSNIFRSVCQNKPSHLIQNLTVTVMQGGRGSKNTAVPVVLKGLWSKKDSVLYREILHE